MVFWDENKSNERTIYSIIRQIQNYSNQIKEEKCKSYYTKLVGRGRVGEMSDKKIFWSPKITYSGEARFLGEGYII